MFGAYAKRRPTGHALPAAGSEPCGSCLSLRICGRLSPARERSLSPYVRHLRGQYNFGNLEPVERRTLVAMSETLRHRGPDDEGSTSPGRSDSAFGGVRSSTSWSVISRCRMSKVPVWVVFNGEIHNFPELRRELEGHGHVSARNRTPKSSFTGTSSGATMSSITSTVCLAWPSGMCKSAAWSKLEIHSESSCFIT